MSTEWRTYQEAADLLGIKPQSVKKRAIRRHWPRMTGNDGLARVQLPDDALPTVPVDIPGDVSPSADDIADRFRTELAEAQEALARAEGENAANRERITDLMTERDRLLSLLETRPAGFWARLLGKG